MKVIGIDPGVTGCIAYYDGSELLLRDMPHFEIAKNGTKRKRIDVLGVRAAMVEFCEADHVFIEQVSAQFGNGAASAFTFGWGCGVIEAVVQLSGLPFTYVSAMKWKKELGVPADKDAARMIASRLLPQGAENWQRKKDDGRAESALIALWGYNQALKGTK